MYLKRRSIYVAFAFLFALTFSRQITFAATVIDKTAAPDTSFLVVRTMQGLLKGTTEKEVDVWRGVRYAKAPVGDLRFRAPQPLDNWNGIKEATEFGEAAPQGKNSFVKGQVTSEDCLYLNVWSPAADGKKRPVMVWIHGGGFEIGSGSADLYNGANMAQKGDVVVVTLNYRLGTLGFLYFGKEAGPAFENNLGIRDQMAALQWVEENIAAFGGDPDQVTIFGESAGGTSVETLLACPAAKGLFKGAIAESGPAAMLWRPETASTVTAKYLEFLGLTSDNLQQLKTLPLDTLMAAQKKLSGYLIKETANKVFSPTIDGRLITTDLFTCLSPKQSGGIPLMIGTNKDESSMFASHRLKMAPNNQKDLNKELLHRFKEEDKEKITAAYPRFPHKRGILDLLTDAAFRMPAIYLAECQTHVAPVYMYRFEWSPFLLKLAGLRSFHGLEIPFVFGNINGRFGRLLHLMGTKKVVSRLSNQMQQSWINFARYGNPNGKEEGEWKKYNTTERPTMIFDKHSRLVDDPDSTQRKAWEGIYYYY